MVKIFFAGEGYVDIQSECQIPTLVNYYYIKDYKNALIYKSDCKLKELFLDSGAFTAWTKNVNIPIEEYCDFVKKADCDFYSVLDVIGDAEATLKNQKKMEELGTKPIPCFHYGDDFKYLDYYYEHYDFISLGGMVGKSTKLLKPWLDTIFLNYPNKKYHGFGLTRVNLIKRYPWYSVDSSSWIQWGVTKRIFSYEHGIFYLGKNKSVCELIVNNNENLKTFLNKYNLNTKDFYDNYKEILKANLYGFQELSHINDNKILKQKQLF